MSESLDVVTIKSRCQKEFVRSYRPCLQHRLYTEDNTFHYRYSAYLLHYKYYLRLYEDQLASESVNKDISAELLKPKNNIHHNNSKLNVQISFLTTDLVDEDRNIMSICVESILNERNDCVTIDMNSLKYCTIDEVFSDLVLRALQCLQKFKLNNDSSSTSTSTYNYKSGHKYYTTLSSHDSNVLDLMNEVHDLMVLDPTSAFSMLVQYFAGKRMMIYVMFPHAESIPYDVYRDMLELWRSNGYAYNTRIISIHAAHCRIPLNAQTFIDYSLNRCTSIRSINESFISRILCTRKLPSSIYSSLNNNTKGGNSNGSSSSSRNNIDLDLNLSLMQQDKCIRSDVRRAAQHYCRQFRNDPSLSYMYQESKWVGLLSRDSKAHHKITDPVAITTENSKFNSNIDRNDCDKQTLSYLKKYVDDVQNQTEPTQQNDIQAEYDQQLLTTISLRVKQVLFFFLISARGYNNTKAYDDLNLYTIWFTGVSDIIDVNKDDIMNLTMSTTTDTTPSTTANLKRRKLQLQDSLSNSLLYSILMSIMLSTTTADSFNYDSFNDLFRRCFSIMIELSRPFGQETLVQTSFTQLMGEVEVYNTLLPQSKKISNLNNEDQEWYQQIDERTRRKLREKCVRNICAYIKFITTSTISSNSIDTMTDDKNDVDTHYNHNEVDRNHNNYELFSNNFRSTFLRALEVPSSSSSSSNSSSSSSSSSFLSMEADRNTKEEEVRPERDVAAIYRLISTSDEIKTVHELFCEWQQEASSALWPDNPDGYEDVSIDGARRGRKRKVDTRKPPANVRDFAQVQLHYRFLTVLHHLEHHGIIKVEGDTVHSLTHAWNGL